MYTPRHAHDLMSKLNNHVFRGVLVSAAVKSTWDLCQRLGRAKGGGRLLVRNLGFDVRLSSRPAFPCRNRRELTRLTLSQITVPDLRAAFARFGPIHSITLPINPSTSKPRGFAFVYFVTRSHAESAMKAVNGTRVFAGMAAERIASEGGKEGKKKEVREKKKAEREKLGGGGGEKGRVVAVDWALSKEEWQKAQEAEAGGEVAEGAASEGEDDDESEGSEDESEEDEDEDSDMSPVPEDLEQDSDMSPEPVGADERDQEDDEEEEKGAQEDERGSTLFVRNMSFEATEAELYDLCVSTLARQGGRADSPRPRSFKQFGPVRYARIVFDPVTKRSRGTAFVCFWNKEHAQAVLAESKALNEGVFGEVRPLMFCGSRGR